MSSLLLNAVTFAINKLYSHGVKLKDEQFRAVGSVLRGKDVLAVLPTGFGKSLMYQILPDVFDYMSANSHLSKARKERMRWFIDLGRVAFECAIKLQS